LALNKEANSNLTKKIVNLLELKDGVANDVTFPETLIHWDTSSVSGASGQLPLEPGFVYTFTAELQITPVLSTEFYHFDSLLWGRYLKYWNIVINSKSVNKVASTQLKTNTMIVRYVVSLNPKVNEIILERSYTFASFLRDFGSFLSIYGLGFLVLQIWQTIFFCCLPEVDNIFVSRDFRIKKYLQRKYKNGLDLESETIPSNELNEVNFKNKEMDEPIQVIDQETPNHVAVDLVVENEVLNSNLNEMNFIPNVEPSSDNLLENPNQDIQSGGLLTIENQGIEEIKSF
jgi:hypothetical protein